MTVRFLFVILTLAYLSACASSTEVPILAQTPSDAIKQLTSECDQGKAASCTELGVIYAEGRGVTRDERRAVQLVQRACDAGFARGCFMLGLMFDEGLGVPKDETRAAGLFP